MLEPGFAESATAEPELPINSKDDMAIAIVLRSFITLLMNQLDRSTLNAPQGSSNFEITLTLRFKVDSQV